MAIGVSVCGSGFDITDTARNLPWFNINQIRVEFTEPVTPISASDVVVRGSPTLGIDYQSSLGISQPRADLLELTLGDNQVFVTDRILVGLLETIRDTDGNAIDGDGDGVGGDPANLRFNVARGDVNSSNLVLSSDVTLVRNSQLGLGPYDPFCDVNGTGLILSDDVTLTRNNQLGLTGSDRALTALALPAGMVAVSQSAKFFVADASRRAYRYQPDGASLRGMDLAANATPTGIAMTADGSRIWTVSSDHRVTVYEADSGLTLGSWIAGDGTAAEGIAVDGANVWLVDAQRARLELYAFAAQRLSGSLAPDRVLALSKSNANPTGIATNGSVILVSDSEENRVFVYSMTGAALGNWPLDGANQDAVGITLDPRGGKDVWVVDRSQRRVYTYQGGVNWRNVASPASNSFPLADAQGEPTDIADPPPAEPLSQYPIETIYGTTSFAQDTDILHVDLTLIHKGNYTLRAPVWLGLRNLSRADVRWLDSDGMVDGQIPYLDLKPWLPSSQWKPGQTSETITLRFHNPSRAPFQYELVLFPAINQPPRITSDPVLFARPDGARYRYDVQAVDPNQDSPLTFDLISSPEGMTIDPLSGRIEWTTGPGESSVGNHRVEVRVSDPEGLSDIQAYTITVLPLDAGNRPPVWLSDPIVSAYVSTDYVYPSRGSDIDGDRIAYSILQGPQGMSIDADTGRVVWRPTDAQLGVHEVVLRVRDDGIPNLWSDQSFQIVVGKQPGNHDPIIVSQPRPIHNTISPNPATGPVTPTEPIVVDLNEGETSTHTVTYTRLPFLPQADVLFLLDDTLSMDNWGTAPRPGILPLLDTFMQAIKGLDAAYPETDFAFGVSRLENFALSDPRNASNRPFILNQPLLRSENTGFERFLQQALLRRAPGAGAGTVSIHEALYQAASGIGLDYGSNSYAGSVGPLNGSTLDYGHSLDIGGQTVIGNSGDVATFNTPRSFAYRVLRIGDYPLLALGNDGAPVPIEGTLNEPRSASVWRFQTRESKMRLQIRTPADLPKSEWILMNPAGAKLYRGDANIDREIALAEPGEYVLVLNSLSDGEVPYRAELALRSDSTPLTLNQQIAGRIRCLDQVDAYSVRFEEWSTVVMDLMTQSTALAWRWIAPDGTVRASERFLDAKGNGPATTNEPILRLAPGTYRLEILDADPTGRLARRDYQLAVRTLSAAVRVGSLAAGDQLQWQHAPDRRSSAAIYEFQSPIDRQRIAIDVPDAVSDPGVRQWVLDSDGHVLHFVSTASSEASYGSNPFVALRAGKYFVVTDADATIAPGPASRAMRLVSQGSVASTPATPIATGSVVAGNVRPVQGAEFEFVVPASPQGRDYYWDPLTPSDTVAWTLRSPAGAVIARSRMNGSAIQGNDPLPRLSNRAFRLPAGLYRLSLQYAGEMGLNPSANFQFRIVDMASLARISQGDIRIEAGDAAGSKLVRIDRADAASKWFLSGGSSLSNRWSLWGPDHTLRFDLPGTADGGLQATLWDSDAVGDYWIDFGPVTQSVGTRLAQILPRRVLENNIDGTQMNGGTYITAPFENTAVENHYRFELQNPGRFYFEPRPSYRTADADWSLVGPAGEVVSKQPFSVSASAAAPEANNTVWLREGEYRLMLRSRSGDVDFRWVDLANAGQSIGSTAIDGSAGPNPEGTRFFIFDGRLGDWNRIRLTEPTNGSSTGLLRIRAVDAFGRNVTTRFVPGPNNNLPSPGYVDIDLDLPTSGRVTLMVEDPENGNLRRSFSLQRQYRSSFPASQQSTLAPSVRHAVDIDSSRLLYDATLSTKADDRWFFDGLSSTGDRRFVRCQALRGLHALRLAQRFTSEGYLVRFVGLWVFRGISG